MSWSSSRSCKRVVARRRVGRDLGHRRVLDQQRGRVDPHAGGAAVEPEPQDRLVLGPDVRVVPVQVGLLGREEVQVPLAGRAVRVRRPGPGLAAEELRGPAGRRLRAVVAPARAEPEALALGRSRTGLEGCLEPGVPVGDVVRDDVDDRPDAVVEGVGDERLGLLERPEGRVDRAVVGDVVAAVGERREVPRREPDRVDPEVAQVGEPGPDAGEVAGPVAVGIGEAPDVDLVDDGAPPPVRIVGGRRDAAVDGDLRGWGGDIGEDLTGHVVSLVWRATGSRRRGNVVAAGRQRSAFDK